MWPEAPVGNEPAEPVRVGEHVDLVEPGAGDGGAHDGQRASVCHDRGSGGSVDQCRSGDRGEPSEGDRLLGHGRCADDRGRTGARAPRRPDRSTASETSTATSAAWSDTPVPPPPWSVALTAKAAGAVSLTVGLGVPVVGVLAGAGLVLYFAGPSSPWSGRWYSPIPFRLL